MSAAAAIASLVVDVHDFAEYRREQTGTAPRVRIEQDSAGQRRRVHTLAVVVDGEVVATGSSLDLAQAARRALAAFSEWSADQPDELAHALRASVLSARIDRHP